jgi:hypothetical protein
MSAPKPGWMRKIAPMLPFLVLLVAALVAAHHVIFNW